MKLKKDLRLIRSLPYQQTKRCVFCGNLTNKGFRIWREDFEILEYCSPTPVCLLCIKQIKEKINET